MKKRIVLAAVLAAVMLFPVFAQDAAGTGTASKYEQKKQTLAVFDFKAKSAGLEAEAAKLTEEATRLLSELKRFNVRDIDPNTTTKAMKELEFQLTGATKEQNIQVGSIEGYNKAITGTLSEFKIDKPNFFSKKKEYTANIEVIVKVIDLSDMTVKVEKISASKSDENESTAVKEAYNQIFMWMKLQFRKWFPIEVFIPETDGAKATLYVGDNMGVYEGMKFRIFNIETKERKDGKISTRKIEQGTLKVNSVQETESTAVWVRGRGPKAEDWISELPMIGLTGAFGIGMASMNVTYAGTNSINNNTLPLGLTPAFTISGEYGASWWRLGFDVSFLLGNVLTMQTRAVFGIEQRLKAAWNIDIIGEMVQLNIEPYIGIAEAISPIGSWWIYNFWAVGLTFGGGGNVKLKIAPNDFFALTLRAGGRWYMPISDQPGSPLFGWALYESTTDSWGVGWMLGMPLPVVNFTGLEAAFNLELYF